VLRAHEEKKCYVLDAEIRSFPDIEPIGVRWTFPLWRVDETLDPSRLKPDRPSRPKAERPVDPAEVWDAERLVAECLTTDPIKRGAVIDIAHRAGLSLKMANRLLDAAESQGIAYRWKVAGRKREAMFASVPQDSLMSH
jgi:hypothetical protein